MKRIVLISCLTWLCMPAMVLSASTAKEDSFLLSFVVGDYAVVGRHPDSSTAYSGTARIERTKNKLILTRHIGSKTIKADGGIEVPQPPGEGQVLRFRWQDKDHIVMTCLANGDLDNYPRLTCILVVEGQRHSQPGLEALFPSVGQPQEGPN